MRSPVKMAAFAIAAFLTACSFPSRGPRTYSATVERIDERPGKYYYSPLNGQDPLFCITLDLADPSNAGKNWFVRVLVLDMYKPAIHGKVGDRVLFGYPGIPPRDGEVNFDTLADYRIAPRAAR